MILFWQQSFCSSRYNVVIPLVQIRNKPTFVINFILPIPNRIQLPQPRPAREPRKKPNEAGNLKWQKLVQARRPRSPSRPRSQSDHSYCPCDRIRVHLKRVQKLFAFNFSHVPVTDSDSPTDTKLCHMFWTHCRHTHTHGLDRGSYPEGAGREKSALGSRKLVC